MSERLLKAKKEAQLAMVAQLDACLTGDYEVAGSTPAGLATFFMEIDHEIFSTVILSHPLIQEGQLSVSGKRMCTVLLNLLEDCLPCKDVVS